MSLGDLQGPRASSGVSLGVLGGSWWVPERSLGVPAVPGGALGRGSLGFLGLYGPYSLDELDGPDRSPFTMNLDKRMLPGERDGPYGLYGP